MNIKQLIFFRRLSKKNSTYLKVSTYLWMNEKPNTNVNLIATSIALKKKTKKKKTNEVYVKISYAA